MGKLPLKIKHLFCDVKLIPKWAFNKIEIKVPSIDILLFGTVGGWSIRVPQIPKISALARGSLVMEYIGGYFFLAFSIRKNGTSVAGSTTSTEYKDKTHRNN